MIDLVSPIVPYLAASGVVVFWLLFLLVVVLAIAKYCGGSDADSDRS